ncbi:hypothetical protein IBJ83_07955 [Parvimonas sp. S3374]|uniref:Uncharacterized protein n=2 Tax=Parvimonas parva TaxID=2769485 RepID=A0ABS1CB71_9FIRM|nr:hypothetical protein [Parvimonas parva]
MSKMYKYYKNIDLQQLIKLFFIEKDLHEIRKEKRKNLEKKLAYNNKKLKNLQKILSRLLRKKLKSDIEIKDIILEKKLTIRENFKIEEELYLLKNIYSEEEYTKFKKIFDSYSDIEKSILEDYYLKQKTIKYLNVKYYYEKREIKKTIKNFSEIVANIFKLKE